jgi:hypothetical protein
VERWETRRWKGGDGCAQPAALGVGSITDADISEGCENLVEEWIEALWNTATLDHQMEY